MSRRLAIGGIVVLVIAAFWLGEVIGHSARHDVQIIEASGRTTDDSASFQVGNTFYYMPSQVEWTANDGTWHSGSWPECLPKNSEVSGFTIGIDILWVQQQQGIPEVIWVDCEGQPILSGGS